MYLYAVWWYSLFKGVWEIFDRNGIKDDDLDLIDNTTRYIVLWIFLCENIMFHTMSLYLEGNWIMPNDNGDCNNVKTMTSNKIPSTPPSLKTPLIRYNLSHYNFDHRSLFYSKRCIFDSLLVVAVRSRTTYLNARVWFSSVHQQMRHRCLGDGTAI